MMGSPDVQPGQALGVYLWHGSNGYSLRATHPGHGKVVIAGRLTASRSFSHITRVRLEPDAGRGDVAERFEHVAEYPRNGSHGYAGRVIGGGCH